MLKFLLFVMVIWFILRFMRRIFMVSSKSTTFTNTHRRPSAGSSKSRRSSLDEIEEAEYIEISHDENKTEKE